MIAASVECDINISVVESFTACMHASVVFTHPTQANKADNSFHLPLQNNI